MIRVKATLIDIWRNITVEPVILIYIFSVGLNGIARPNLLLQKACFDKFNFTTDECMNIDKETHDIKDQVQTVVTNYESTVSLVAFIPRIFFALLAGHWSDHHGRKYIIGIPIFGQVLTSITLLINSIFIVSTPFELLYLELVNELCGNFIVYYLGIYSYVTDVSSPKSRTTRLAVADGMDYTSSMIGSLAGAQLYGVRGFNAVFALSAGLCILALLYLVIFVKESERIADANHQKARDYGAVEQKSPSTEASLCESFNIFASIKVAFRKRSGFKRTMIFMLIFNYCCYILAYDGMEGTHRYLFTNKVYNWNEETFSFYYSTYRICYLITLWFILPSLNKHFTWHDASIAILASTCGAVGSAIPMVITPAWGFYLGSIIGSLNPACPITSRSMVSHCVHSDEVGKILSLFTVMSALSSSLGTAGFQKLYSITLTTFPGAFLVAIAILYVIALPNNFFLRRRLTNGSNTTNEKSIDSHFKQAEF